MTLSHSLVRPLSFLFVHTLSHILYHTQYLIAPLCTPRYSFGSISAPEKRPYDTLTPSLPLTHTPTHPHPHSHPLPHLSSHTHSPFLSQVFLRLYFRTREEVHDAVVYALRANGCLVYVPAFDYKGAVFLQVSNG